MRKSKRTARNKNLQLFDFTEDYHSHSDTVQQKNTREVVSEKKDKDFSMIENRYERKTRENSYQYENEDFI